VSGTFITALCLQATGIISLRHRLGRTWWRRPVVMLVFAAVAYNGVSEILISIPSIGKWDIYHQGIKQSYIDMAALIMSVGLLCLVICYLLAKPESAAASARVDEAPLVGRYLDWRLFAIACAPLAVLTYEGRGYNNSISAATVTTSSDLATTFLILLVALAAFGFLLRHGMKWFVVVLGLQSALLAAAGERLPIVMEAITLLVLLAEVGLRPSGRQVAVTLLLTVVAALGITGLRAESGRGIFLQNSGLKARVAAVGDGFYFLFHTSDSKGTGPGLITQSALRLDGTSFAGSILQGIRLGHPPLGVAGVGESTLLVVPSSIWPSKLTHSGYLDPAQTEMDDFGLQQTNFLPTFLGLYLGFLGPYWLILFLGAVGALFGWGERWLFRKVTAVRLAVLAAAMQSALSYEKGLPGMLVQMRTAVVLALAVWLFRQARDRGRREAGVKGSRHCPATRATAMPEAAGHAESADRRTP